MKLKAIVMLLAVLLLSDESAFAEFCALDQVPAASLLYPFVVFDYNNPYQGENTLFSVTDVAAAPQIVHFVLWTDYGQRVLDWNVVLSGYDVQTFAVRDLLKSGVIQSTGTDGLEASAPRAEGPADPIATLPAQGDRGSKRDVSGRALQTPNSAVLETAPGIWAHLGPRICASTPS